VDREHTEVGSAEVRRKERHKGRKKRAHNAAKGNGGRRKTGNIIKKTST
jgi:hypothetical protein